MNTVTRRGLMLGATTLAAAGPAGAQAPYPTRPITLVVPAAAGGGGDFTARLLGEALMRPLGQPVVIENRVGGSGNVAATYVARAQPDGQTLLLAYSGSHVANPALFRNLQWDPVRSFDPVALVITAPHVIVVRKTLPATNLTELIAYAKANPGKLNYATSGTGTIQHIGTEQFARLAGISMTHVPYRGAGPAMNDLLAGTIDLIITTPPAIVSFVQADSVRALAITSRTRHPMLPDVPTTAEAGMPGFELEAWFGIYAPAGTPPPVIARLTEEIGRIVNSAEFTRRAEESGTYATYQNPVELAAFTRSELARWSAIIHDLGITLD
ncbi:MAG TPA: tripartite tricarboxylate transporter substrate binding protein [Roseomonas sp.]|jgi:tripartite-type tricarboxylate transporter receptor subunit TctC